MGTETVENTEPDPPSLGNGAEPHSGGTTVLTRMGEALSRFQPVLHLEHSLPIGWDSRPDAVAQVIGAAQQRATRIMSVLRLVLLASIGGDLVFYPPGERAAATYTGIVLYTLWSIGQVFRAWHNSLPSWTAWSVLCVDLPVLTILLAISGTFTDSDWGTPFSEDVFLLIPILAMFQLRPLITAICGAASTLVYTVATIIGHEHRAPDPHYVIVHAVFIVLVTTAAVLLTWVQQSHVSMIATLARDRSQLLAQTLAKEDRERRHLAEALHDGPLQNVLMARQDVEEVAEVSPSESLDRAESALRETTRQLRSSLSDLHPAVLEHGGLRLALHQLVEQAAARARWGVDISCDIATAGFETDRILYQCARELMGNIGKHAQAQHVAIRLTEDERWVRLRMSDDGVGLPPGGVQQAIPQGHIGLASQRVRIESAGGTMTLRDNEPHGTIAEISLPRRIEPPTHPPAE
ncbi:sensor histidine kinase [Streptomyces vinaceus]|uniref:sensor histidine kinase n=1 Tax=Streptomyces vinaceus TaxID=1960 RepID=UPI0038022BED